MLFFAIIVGIIIDLLKKERTREIRILGISIVGIAIFLLVWEARSRYIYFLIPIFIILGAYGICNIEKIVEQGMKKLKKNKEN